MAVSVNVVVKKLNFKVHGLLIQVSDLVYSILSKSSKPFIIFDDL